MPRLSLLQPINRLVGAVEFSVFHQRAGRARLNLPQSIKVKPRESCPSRLLLYCGAKAACGVVIRSCRPWTTRGKLRRRARGRCAWEASVFLCGVGFDSKTATEIGSRVRWSLPSFVRCRGRVEACGIRIPAQAANWTSDRMRGLAPSRSAPSCPMLHRTSCKGPPMPGACA